MPRHIRRNPMFIKPEMELLEVLLRELMDPEEERLSAALDKIVVANQKLGGTMNGFYHLGTLYSSVKPYALRGIKVANLHDNLIHEFEQHLSERQQYEADRQRLTQLLTTILPKCRNVQQIRDALPEALVLFVPDLKKRERMDPEGFLLKSNPMLAAQFEEASNIALFYVANRMVY